MNKRLPGIIMLILTTLACTISGADSDSTTATPNAVTVTEEATSGTQVAYGPVSMILPPGLADSINGKMITSAEEANLPPLAIVPTHTRIELNAYPLQSRSDEPKLSIYQTQDCGNIPGYNESLQRLKTILANPDMPLTNEILPAVPLVDAGQIFAANGKVISFQNGQGVRFLTEYSQYCAPVNNQELIYHFEGLTADGQYYIIAILPVTMPRLPETAQADAPVPDGGVPLPQEEYMKADWESYYASVKDLLEASPADDFTPTLDQLDQLIQSLAVGPIYGND